MASDSKMANFDLEKLSNRQLNLLWWHNKNELSEYHQANQILPKKWYIGLKK